MNTGARTKPRMSLGELEMNESEHLAATPHTRHYCLTCRLLFEVRESWKEIVLLHATIKDWERNAELAFENPDPNCDCPGCSLARVQAADL